MTIRVATKALPEITQKTISFTTCFAVATCFTGQEPTPSQESRHGTGTGLRRTRSVSIPFDGQVSGLLVAVLITG